MPAEPVHPSTRVPVAPDPARTDVLDHPTPSSIAAARAAQKRERAEFYKATGIHVGRNGHPIFTHRLVSHNRLNVK